MSNWDVYKMLKSVLLNAKESRNTSKFCKEMNYVIVDVNCQKIQNSQKDSRFRCFIAGSLFALRGTPVRVTFLKENKNIF